MTEQAASFIGAWRIVQMDLWDLDTIDLVEPGSIQFGDHQRGRFRFVAVEGWMDCRYGLRDGRPGVEFTWEGWDEGDKVGGRGWAVHQQDGSLRGRIHFHLGDDSGFHAVRVDERQPRAG